MTPIKDPLSLAQETFEAYIIASPAIVAAFKTSNAAMKKIDGFTSARGTKATDVTSEADLPSVKLIPVGGPCNVNFSSNACSMDYTLQIGLLTGDLRYNALCAPVVFALYSTMAKAIHDAQLVGVTLARCLPADAEANLRSYQFIKNLTLSDIGTGFADLTDPRNKGIAGFSGLLNLTLHMIFPRAFVHSWATQSFS